MSMPMSKKFIAKKSSDLANIFPHDIKTNIIPVKINAATIVNLLNIKGNPFLKRLMRKNKYDKNNCMLAVIEYNII